MGANSENIYRKLFKREQERDINVATAIWATADTQTFPFSFSFAIFISAIVSAVNPFQTTTNQFYDMWEFEKEKKKRKGNRWIFVQFSKRLTIVKHMLSCYKRHIFRK